MVICVPPGMGEQPRSDQVSADRLIDEERDACDRSKSHHRERLQGQAARGTCRAAQQAVAGEKHCQTEQNQVASNATSPILGDGIDTQVPKGGPQMEESLSGRLKQLGMTQSDFADICEVTRGRSDVNPMAWHLLEE
jgi:hypothetical protein